MSRFMLPIMLCMALGTALLAFGSPAPADQDERALTAPPAETIAVSREEWEALKAEVAGLRLELEALKTASAPPTEEGPHAETAPATTQPTVLGGGSAQGVPQTELPDISVIGNIVGLASSNRAAENRNDIVVRELELGLQGYLYPQVRADAFIALSEEHGSTAVLEEGYVTFLQPRDLKLLAWMPRDTSLRLGRKLLDFGKVNPIHPHHWPYVNAPAAIQDFMGHGFGGDGVSVSYLLPTTTFTSLELGAWKFSPHAHEHEEDGEEHEGPGSGFQDRVYSGRLWTSHPVGERAELELGLSGAVGHGYRHHHHEGEEEEEEQLRDRIALTGIDLTYKRWPEAHKRLLLQGEALWHRRRGGGEGRTSLGYYLFGNYKWDKYWDAGLLYGAAELPFPAEGRSSGLSAILTNHLTETTKLRLQLDLNRQPEVGRSTELWLQCLWGIGPHSHPLE